MGRRRRGEEERPRGTAVPEVDTVKLALQITGESDYRFRIYCATRSLTPSQMVQQMILERIRGEKLPPGCSYIPRRLRIAAETVGSESEDNKVA
jgi:hypothetical protein